MTKVSIVIPAFNEAESIALLLAQVKETLSLIPYNLEREVIIVDDGSTDGTRAILQDYKEWCTIIFHDRNRGLSAAMDTALKRCTGDIIIVQHADLEYPPKFWPVLLEPILSGTADMVAGSRLLNKDNPYFKRTYKWGGVFITRFMNALFFSNLTDIITAARAFRRELIDIIHFSGVGFAFEVEITTKALRHGFRIQEVSIDFKPRTFEEGKKIRWHHIFGILSVIIKSRFCYRVRARASIV